MKNIADLVNSAFVEKFTHGPASDQFKSAQNAAFIEINNIYDVGACEIIKSGEINGAGDEIGIRIEKKGEGPNMCSFVKLRIQI